MNQKIPGSVEEYINTQLLGSAKDFHMTSNLEAVGALEHENKAIIYGIIVPDRRRTIPKECTEGGRTRLSKDLSKCLDGENLGNWIMLAQPTNPDYQEFLKYIVIQAYEENNNNENELLVEIECKIIKEFINHHSFKENRDEWSKDDNDIFFKFMMARLSFYKGKLKETGKSELYYKDIQNIIEMINNIT